MITVIGFGEESPPLLTKDALSTIENAEVIMGSESHLANVVTDAKRLVWVSPFFNNIDIIKQYANQRIVILATGDPMWFGIGAILLRNFEPTSLHFISHTSSFNLAASRLQWSIQDCYCLSAHGRGLDTFMASLQPNQRYLILTSDIHTLHHVEEVLLEHEGQGSQLTLLENLGSEHERIIKCTAGDIPQGLDPHFYVLGVETTADTALHNKLTAGIDDALFQSDGQLTKDWMRSITLSRLKPRRNEILWDIGAGSGSISIEWARLTGGEVFAVERDETRISTMIKNKDRLGGIIHMTEGDIDESDLYLGFSNPNAIFMGGGLVDVNQLEFFIGHLLPHGRLVVNTVTQKGEIMLNQAFRELGGNLERFGCDRMGELGNQHAYRPSLRVTQWWYQNG